MASYSRYGDYEEEEEEDEWDSFSDDFSRSSSYQGSCNGIPDWCICSDCVYLSDPREQNCCRSYRCMVEYMDEYDGVECITDHPGFQSVVLNPFVLETAYYSYRKTKYRRGRLSIRERSNYRMYRYTAYRQLVRWCWGILGEGNRVDLPACAIAAIRNTFHRGYSNLPDHN